MYKLATHYRWALSFNLSYHFEEFKQQSNSFNWESNLQIIHNCDKFAFKEKILMWNIDKHDFEDFICLILKNIANVSF